MVQAYVPHEGDLWDATRDAVESFLHDVEAETEPPELDASGRGFLLRLSRREPPASAIRLLGPSLATAETLGRRLGEMHGVLAAADPADPGLAPEAMSPFHVRSLYQSIRGRVHAARRRSRPGGLRCHPARRPPRTRSWPPCPTSRHSWRPCATCAWTPSASGSTATCTWGTSWTRAATSSSSTSRVTPGGPSASGA